MSARLRGIRFRAGVGVSVLALSLAVTGLTGCATAQQLSAKDSVREAVASISDASAVRLRLSLDSSLADLKALEAAQGPSERSSQQQMGWLLDGSLELALEAPAGRTLGSAPEQSGTTPAEALALLKDPAALSAALKEKGDGSIAVRLRDATLIELRSVGSMVYVRADLPTLLTMAGQDSGRVEAMASSLPPSLAPLAGAARGKWVAVDLVEAATAANSLGLFGQLESAIAAQPAPTLSPAALTSLLHSLATAYERNVTIRQVEENAERGTAYELSAPARQLSAALAHDLAGMAGPQAAGQVRAALAQVPDRTVSVVVWVKDGKLRAVSLDLAQFADPHVAAHAALDLDIVTDGVDITAPQDAQTLNVSGAILGLGSMFATR